MHAHFRRRQYQTHPKCHLSTIRVPIRPDRITLVMNFLLRPDVQGRYSHVVDTTNDTMVFTFADPNTAFDFKMRFA